MAAMVGGGIKAKPGEASMAHHGVLFLDELPEFTSQVLDSLRQPLENGEAVISRANRHVKYPSRFQLVAAANPCKCGGGPGAFACRKGPACQANYFSRISGPFLDRIDIFVDVAPVTAMDLSLPRRPKAQRRLPHASRLRARYNPVAMAIAAKAAARSTPMRPAPTSRRYAGQMQARVRC